MDVLRKVESSLYISQFTCPAHTEQLLRTKLPTCLSVFIHALQSTYITCMCLSVKTRTK